MIATIKKTIETFASPGDVVEIRVVEAERGGVLTGCFNDFEKLAIEAAKLDGHAPAIYFTLNKCDPLIFARSPNKMSGGRGKVVTTGDSDIIRRRWFPIDADAIKPTGVSSPDGLHEAALAVADDIEEWLAYQGWPKPVKGDSGNGGHLCYRLDFPNEKEITDAIQAATAVLTKKFSTFQVSVDKAVFNASRIWKLYGTMAGKGANIPGQPHRRATLLSVPDSVQVVSLEMIQKIAAMGKPVVLPKTNNTTKPMQEIDVEEKCRAWGLNIVKDSAWKDGHKYVIKPCPFNSQHEEAVIIKQPSGAVGFKCPHNSCADNHWAEFRALYEQKPERKPFKPLECSDFNPWEGMDLRDEAPVKPKINERIDPAADLEKMKNNVALQASGERVTIELPWPRLSQRSGALRPGTVCLLGGPVKSGKSYMAMNIIAHLQEKGHPWKYLPLEDDRDAWMFRMLAILFDDYVYTDDKQETAATRFEAIEKHAHLLKPFSLRVCENPRTGIVGPDGKAVVPPVNYPAVLDWVEDAVKTSRLVVVDPLAQIDFDAKRQYQQHQEFIRKMLAIVSGKNCTILLLVHLGKRGGDKAANPMTADDVQGSVDLTRLAHTTLLLDRHEDTESEIHRPGGMHLTCTHNRTLVIAAVRNGSGGGQKVALTAGANGPRFEEHGIIDCQETQRKKKQRGKIR